MKLATRNRTDRRQASRAKLKGRVTLRPRRRSRLIGRKQIAAYCQAIAREFRPSKIVLFGSYAYGNPTADSDVDLLVVLPFRGSDVSKAIQIRSRFDTPFPLDLLVRKPKFITSRLQERDMFIELVMNQGRVMYES